MFPPPSNNFLAAVRGILFMLIQPPAHLGLESQKVWSLFLSCSFPFNLPQAPCISSHLSCARVRANQCLYPPHGRGEPALIKALQLVTQPILTAAGTSTFTTLAILLDGDVRVMGRDALALPPLMDHPVGWTSGRWLTPGGQRWA